MTVSKQKLPDISSVVITAADVSYTLQCSVIQSVINFIWSWSTYRMLPRKIEYRGRV